MNTSNFLGQTGLCKSSIAQFRMCCIARFSASGNPSVQKVPIPQASALKSKKHFAKMRSLHPSDAVQGLGCSPTSILQRKNDIYIRVKTPLVSTMRLLKTPPKFDNHFARMIVRFQAQLEADGCFSARKSSEFAFRCKQNELSSPLFLPKFPSFFLASCRNQLVLKSSRLRSGAEQ